jgi:CTP:molybdopterin cytidylyltransferase MocA
VDELSAVVLAAGASSRMGAPKPLLTAGGSTLLAWAAGAFRAAGVDDVVVVTGHRGEDVGAAAAALGARSVHNPRYADGMFTSVQAGAAAVAAGRGFFLLPVDCPLVRPETVGRLAREGAVSGAAVAVPVCGGAPGHPPLLAPALRAEILAARPAGGLRELLAARPERVVPVEVDDPGVLDDADTPADLQALRARAALEKLPSRHRCLELLRQHGADDALVEHCLAVAAVAGALAAALNERRQHLCVPLVEAAALLHDVVRARPRHAAAGAELLMRIGYPRLAPVVAGHMGLGEAAGLRIDEARLVFLADKLVIADRCVGLEERFAARLRQARDDAARAAVLARRDEAVLVRARVEDVLGASVADLAASALKSAGG